jgi:hypothetical protein
MNNLYFIYGLPIYKINIHSLIKEEKKKIINIIIKNYNKDPLRNNWDKNSVYKSTIHHCYNDYENKNFNKVDFKFLVPHYKKIIDSFCKEMKVINKYKYTFKIVNYTASKKESFMKFHLHEDCNFSMVHYLKFNNKKHTPTLFESPYYFNDLLPFKNTFKIFSKEDLKNLWHEKEVFINTVEDDVIIFPSILKHGIFQKKTNELRITIASNIMLEENI